MKNIPCLESFRDVVETHIPHMYGKENKQPTQSVSSINRITITVYYPENAIYPFSLRQFTNFRHSIGNKHRDRGAGGGVAPPPIIFL